MDQEFTIKVSGTSGTKFRFDYRVEGNGGILALLSGRASSRWHRADGTVPAEYHVTGKGVELRNVQKRSTNGTLTVEILGPPGVMMKTSL